jgi:hypothetical protein
MVNVGYFQQSLPLVSKTNRKYDEMGNVNNEAHDLLGNVLSNRRRCERIAKKNSWRHIYSVDPWRTTSKNLQDLTKRKDLSRRPPIVVSRNLRYMHDGISFDKILPKQVGYIGTRFNWKQP